MRDRSATSRRAVARERGRQASGPPGYSSLVVCGRSSGRRRALEALWIAHGFGRLLRELGTVPREEGAAEHARAAVRIFGGIDGPGFDKFAIRNAHPDAAFVRLRGPRG